LSLAISVLQVLLFWVKTGEGEAEALSVVEAVVVVGRSDFVVSAVSLRREVALG
jgi:hypothetical protein